MIRRAAVVLVAVLVALAAGGCGRKAKPEPLWSATRLSAITESSR